MAARAWFRRIMKSLAAEVKGNRRALNKRGKRGNGRE